MSEIGRRTARLHTRGRVARPCAKVVLGARWEMRDRHEVRASKPSWRKESDERRHAISAALPSVEIGHRRGTTRCVTVVPGRVGAYRARIIFNNNIVLDAWGARSQERACRENRCADKLLARDRAAPFYLASGSSHPSPVRLRCSDSSRLHIGLLWGLLLRCARGVHQGDKWSVVRRLTRWGSREGSRACGLYEGHAGCRQF